MDFSERELTFEEVERRSAELKQRYDAGEITDGQFDAGRKELMVQDEQGRYWVAGREKGVWFYHNGSEWIRGAPPVERRREAEAPSEERGRPDAEDESDPVSVALGDQRGLRPEASVRCSPCSLSCPCSSAVWESFSGILPGVRATTRVGWA